MNDPGPPADPNEPTVEVSAERRPAARLPEHISHYHIKRMIASGGMGTVYEATQERPRRVVAVKVMKQGISSRTALRRFEYEAQILARLRHPGIAQIYEAGTHDDGTGPVPFFAMEYIPNATRITAFADEKKLSLRRRLELFAHACDAVHHGHQKGIIHRDLKPANILVDSHGELKIIDFGVARGTDSDMAVTTLQTDMGELIGTIQYMSPEQCEADPHDIDIRSDVYALGVVLYQLLSGKLPYDVSRHRMLDSTRVIREQQPTRLSTIDTSLRGDIETIVIKAMEKERDRRYQSALELAQDIRRFLAGEAIVARRPSLFYQFRIFARRNRGLVAALAGVFVALLAGFLVSTSLYFRSERERGRAVTAEAKAHAINEFLVNDLLSSADPTKAQGRVLTVRDALDIAARQVDTAFPDQPAIGASVRSTLGRTYVNLGLYSEAEPHFAAALALQRGLLGSGHPDTLDTSYWKGMLLTRQGTYDEAESILRQTLNAQQHVLGREHPDTLRSWNALAVVLNHRGRNAEAIDLARSTLALQQRVLGAEHGETLRATANLAAYLVTNNEHAEAAELTNKALQIARRTLGEEHPETIRFMANLSVSLRETGKTTEAVQLAARAMDLARRVLGDDHPSTLFYASMLAAEPGDLTNAARLLDAQRKKLGDDHPQVISSMGDLATRLGERGKLIEALTMARQAYERAQRVFGEDHAETIRLMGNLAIYLSRTGEGPEAITLTRKGYEMATRALPENHSEVERLMGNLAAFLSDQGEVSEAKSLAREALELSRKMHGRNHPETLRWTANVISLLVDERNALEASALADEFRAALPTILSNAASFPFVLMISETLDSLGESAKAVQVGEALVESAQKKLGPQHAQTLGFMCSLALKLQHDGRVHEARDLALRCRDVFERREFTLRNEAQDFSELTNQLALALAETGSPAEAERLARESYQTRREQAGEFSETAIYSKDTLAFILYRQGRYAEAEPLYAEVFDAWGSRYAGNVLGATESRLRYGQCLLGLDKFEAAESQLLKAHDVYHPDWLPGHRLTRETIESLVKLYETWGKKDAAASWQEKLDRLPAGQVSTSAGK